MNDYKLPYNAYYGFKIVTISDSKPVEICRCHSQTMAEKIGRALLMNGTKDVQLLHMVGRSWLACGSWVNPVSTTK